jgi:hypothetical protein
LVSVGLGFGAEVEVTDESVTTEHPNSLTWTGYTASVPIKPGSFHWTYLRGTLEVEVYDNGDGTLDDYAGFMSLGTIDYATGFFSRTSQTTSSIPISGDTLNYTTYESDVTSPEGETTSASGFLIATIIVPSVPNGTYTITAIDEMGDVGTGSFQVVGSDVIPEPLTVGAIVLLSSTAVIASFCWTRKRKL